MKNNFNRNIGMWMYQNSGGIEIQQKMVEKLKERDIGVITNLNLRYSEADKNGMRCKGVNVTDLDLFFSYNAGEQTVSQVYCYEQLAKCIPTINNFEAFKLSEDKFQTDMALHKAGINCSDFFLCHRDKPERIKELFEEWGKMVFKPLDGWGGIGMALIENKPTLNTLMPFLNQMDIRHYYIEKFIDNDYSDFRVDIVDGKFVSCYGRKASDTDWRTNISAGGTIIIREPTDEIVDLSIAASNALGMDIAGIDILYDREKEEYVVLEVNGIPAFATPSQEKFGLDFNDKKIDLIVDLIDRKIAGVH